MQSALIGYTGFVGSNLLRQHHFDCKFNSKNFRELKDGSFGDVVCAGISAVKWKANKDPETDRANIQALQDVLLSVKAERFILISTIDVYAQHDGFDEDFDCSSLENHAYGNNRLAFEQFCQQQFPDCYIVRLPGLFGHELKKNIIYDLLTDNCLDMINPDSSFQFYSLGHLWEDIRKVVDAGVHLLNLFPEPVGTGDIIQRFFPEKSFGQNPAQELHYCLHTKHANLWGKTGSYCYSREEILDDMQSFVETWPKGQ